MLSAIEETALSTRAKVDAIRGLIARSIERVRTELPHVYSKELIEVVFRHPYSKISFLEKSGIATRQTASKYLRELSRIGLLQPMKHGREIYFVNSEFLAVLGG